MRRIDRLLTNSDVGAIGGGQGNGAGSCGSHDAILVGVVGECRVLTVGGCVVEGEDGDCEERWAKGVFMLRWVVSRTNTAQQC